VYTCIWKRALFIYKRTIIYVYIYIYIFIYKYTYIYVYIYIYISLYFYLPHSPSHSLSLSLPISLSHAHTQANTHSLSFSLSHTHTCACAFFLSRILSFTLSAALLILLYWPLLTYTYTLQFSCDIFRATGAIWSIYHPIYPSMGWLRLVGSLKCWVSFAKEPHKRDDILQKRPIILRSLLIVATPYLSIVLISFHTYLWKSLLTYSYVVFCTSQVPDGSDLLHPSFPLKRSNVTHVNE